MYILPEDRKIYPQLRRTIEVLVDEGIKSYLIYEEALAISKIIYFIFLFRQSFSQIDYDPGFMYDVSLQIESEFNGDIKSIVPAEHKRHRRKWVLSSFFSYYIRLLSSRHWMSYSECKWNWNDENEERELISFTFRK